VRDKQKRLYEVHHLKFANCLRYPGSVLDSTLVKYVDKNRKPLRLKSSQCAKSLPRELLNAGNHRKDQSFLFLEFQALSF